MIYIKKHNHVLAVCDKEIANKYADFYKGKLVNKATFHKEFLNAENVNLLGKKTIKWASEIESLEVIKLNGIPHSMIMRI